MLILRINAGGGFTLRLGDQTVSVRLLEVGGGGRVKVGVEAPPEVRVLREGQAELPPSDCGNWNEGRQG